MNTRHSGHSAPTDGDDHDDNKTVNENDASTDSGGTTDDGNSSAGEATGTFQSSFATDITTEQTHNDSAPSTPEGPCPTASTNETTDCAHGTLGLTEKHLNQWQHGRDLMDACQVATTNFQARAARQREQETATTNQTHSGNSTPLGDSDATLVATKRAPVSPTWTVEDNMPSPTSTGENNPPSPGRALSPTSPRSTRSASPPAPRRDPNETMSMEIDEIDEFAESENTQDQLATEEITQRLEAATAKRQERQRPNAQPRYGDPKWWAQTEAQMRACPLFKEAQRTAAQHGQNPQWWAQKEELLREAMGGREWASTGAKQWWARQKTVLQKTQLDTASQRDPTPLQPNQRATTLMNACLVANAELASVAEQWIANQPHPFPEKPREQMPQPQQEKDKGRGRGRQATLPAWKTQPHPQTRMETRSRKGEAPTAKEEARPRPSDSQQRPTSPVRIPRPTLGPDQEKICKHGRVKKHCGHCPDARVHTIQWELEMKKRAKRKMQEKEDAASLQKERAKKRKAAAEAVAETTTEPPHKRPTAADMFRTDAQKCAQTTPPPAPARTHQHRPNSDPSPHRGSPKLSAHMRTSPTEIIARVSAPHPTQMENAATVTGEFRPAGSPAKSLFEQIRDTNKAVRQLQTMSGLSADKQTLAAPTTAQLANTLRLATKRWELVEKAEVQRAEISLILERKVKAIILINKDLLDRARNSENAVIRLQQRIHEIETMVSGGAPPKQLPHPRR